MENTEKLNPYQVVTDSIIQAMESGVNPWKGYSVSNRATNFVTDKAYNGGNQLVLQLTGAVKEYRTNLWAGFSQWQSIGVNVNKGEKGTRILRPRMGKDKDTQETKFFGVKYETVFNASQTTCDLSTIEGNQASQLNPIESADKIINGMPQRPEISHTSPSLAYYSPLTDKVTMPVAVTCGSEEYYSILFHELAHSTGHESRLKRDSLTKIQGHSRHEYSKEELVAEMTAAILCNESGILDKTLTNSAAYCASWLKVLKNDRKFLYEAANNSYKAASFILGVK